MLVTDNNGHTCTDTIDAAGKWSCTISPALTDGETPVFKIIITDVAGNESEEVEVSILIDTTAPEMPTIDITTGEPVTGTAEPGSTVQVVTITGDSCTTVADAA